MKFNQVLPFSMYFIIVTSNHALAEIHKNRTMGIWHKSYWEVFPKHHFPITADDLLVSLLATSNNSNVNYIRKSIDELVDLIKLLKSISSTERLRKIYVATHQRFLKTFQEYTGLENIFLSGTYNCLTGVCLFSIVLERFHHKYQIIETNYHIFIITNTRQGDILLETTDRNNGFVHITEEIEKRLVHYKRNVLMISINIPSKKYLTNDFDL